MNYQEKWNRNIAALREYVEANGNADVPSAYSVAVDGRQIFLGPWVSKIKSQYRNGKLLPHRARELEEIPGWRWDASRPGPRVLSGRDQAISERYGAGETPRSIAESFGLTPQRVNQILRRGGQ